MPRKTIEFPKFKNESDEADWWASKEGRAFAEQKSREAQAKGIKFSGSSVIARMNKKSSTQIALRLPGTDIQEARKIAGRKGIGYQTLIKMIVHEGLQREAKRG
jgi:predicted DNA binding CopG/RHH family protein